MTREVDPNDDWTPSTSWQFTDYDGEQPYLDYDVEFDFGADPVTADAYDSLRYLGGGTVHGQQAATNGSVRYYHADITGSTNALSDTGGAIQTGGTTTAGGPFYYTAFGERVYYDTTASAWKLGGEFPTGAPRYLYDGGHGYENGLLSLAGANTSLAPITFQHVGERWYEPDIGRFVQRDPIGLGGGLNVYAYCGLTPIAGVDADGLSWTDESLQNRYNPHPHFPPSSRSWAEWILQNTGGTGTTFLDRWGNRVGVGTPAATTGALIASGRTMKSASGSAQAASKNYWASLIVRNMSGRIAGKVQNAIRVGSLVGLIIADTYACYDLLNEAVYAAYDVPPGQY